MVRIAITSTPRSGNTWLRHILCAAYDAVGITAHSPSDVDWAHLPDDCILQIHWHPTESFRELLEHYAFRVVVVVRHPLDVLISILQFALYNSTARWLEGEAGNEASILGAMPRSDAFLSYCQGPRASVLLGLSKEWWLIPACLRIRYEDLVEDTSRAVTGLTAVLAGTLKRPLHDVIAGASLEKLRASTRRHHHFWQGKVDGWRRFFTAREATLLREIHHSLCTELAYDCAADPDLSGQEADENWIRLAWSRLADKIQNVRILEDIVPKLEAKLSAALEESRNLCERLETVERAAREAGALDPDCLGLARKIQAFTTRNPRMSNQLRQVARLGRWLGLPRLLSAEA